LHKLLNTLATVAYLCFT